ncbi:FUSC family protein [Planctomonas sp. JC2975]|uniref:FUSC family protein n=1 Tax=Planctomonas sp. JC2975 TaxID=2729626 RepID=UPI00147583CC|nr:FUSC family protein [Planctomonas sp. JC2975]NNC11741.1 FUSC family protein [Planctomonas sp. JC2975]
MSTPPGAPSSSWVRELVRGRKAAIPWDLAAITAVAVAVPVGISLAVMQGDPAILGLGVLTSMGALIASISDRGGPAVDRVRRIVVTAVFAAIGLTAGSLALGNDVATVAVVVLAALVSGIAGVISANASQAALQFLVYAIVGSGIDFGLRPLWLAPLVLLCGAAWRLALTGIAILVDRRPRVPERAAVASVYSAVAAQLDAAGSAEADAARRDVTTALNQAFDLMVSARTTLAGRDPRWRSLVTLLNAATPVVEAVTAVVTEGERVPPTVPNALRAIARSIEDPSAPPPVLPPPDRTTPGRAALASSLRLVGSLLSGDDPVTTTVAIQRPDTIGLPRVSPRDRLRTALDHLTSGSETWFAVLRLVVCVAVAEAISVLLPLERPYWITLTVAVVMKPDFGSVFARAVQRGVGTVVGVLIGAAVVVFVPLGWPQVLALALLAGGMPVAIRRNYGLFSIFITPVIVILLELAHGDDTGLIVSRVTDTLIGSAIVILFGYLPWPSTWRSARHLGGRVAEVAADVGWYLGVALAPRGADDSAARKPDARDRSAARRATYRRLSDLRTLVQQTLAEPPPISTAAASWWPEIVALERVTDAITSTAIRAAQTRTVADPDAVAGLGAALADLSSAIREGRAPGMLALSEDPLLEPVSDEIGAARAVLAS